MFFCPLEDIGGQRYAHLVQQRHRYLCPMDMHSLSTIGGLRDDRHQQHWHRSNIRPMDILVVSAIGGWRGARVQLQRNRAFCPMDIPALSQPLDDGEMPASSSNNSPRKSPRKISTPATSVFCQPLQSTKLSILGSFQVNTFTYRIIRPISSKFYFFNPYTRVSALMGPQHDFHTTILHCTVPEERKLFCIFASFGGRTAASSMYYHILPEVFKLFGTSSCSSLFQILLSVEDRRGDTCDLLITDASKVRFLNRLQTKAANIKCPAPRKERQSPRTSLGRSWIVEEFPGAE